MTYLDWASGWPISQAALKKYNEVAKLKGNFSSTHKYGFQIFKIVEQARSDIANYLHIRPKNIIFTSGGTESNNLALQGIYRKAYKQSNGQKKIIVTTLMEHPSVVNTARNLAGKNIIYLKNDKFGLVDLSNLQLVLNEFHNEIALVSIHYVNNEIGAKQEIEKISQMCLKKVISFHTDAVQSHEFSQNRDSSNFFMSISSHKIGGPGQIGVLTVPDFNLLEPVMLGGGQEMGLRSGTLDAASIAAFAEACKEMYNSNKDILNKKFFKLANSFFQSDLLENLSNNRFSINGPPINDQNRVNYIINLSINSNKSPDEIVYLFDSNNIAISFGSACSAKALGPSNVLLALGQNTDQASKGLRISFGPNTEKTDIERFLTVLKLI
ncbi:MAG: aminotransferase class V-fold PLP-dependent enzyme [Bifidobacteriaceae bacterium]|nr:aminotransferase class V-fold PLP-dependent enzyme [Bifidobacteriaceae bacterium]